MKIDALSRSVLGRISVRMLELLERCCAVQVFSTLLLAQATQAADLDLREVANWPGYHRSAGLAIALAGDYAFMAEEAGSVVILDIAKPLQPQQVGRFSSTARAMVISSNYLYLAGYNLEVFDITSPSEPRRLGSLALTNSAEALTVEGSYAYVATVRRGAQDQGRLQIVDIGRPERPVSLGHFDTEGVILSVAASGTHAFITEMPTWQVGTGEVGGGLQVIDVRNPVAPARVGGLNAVGSAVSVAVFQSTAYLLEVPRWLNQSSIGGGVRVVDVSDPLKPRAYGGYVMEMGGNSLSRGAVVLRGNRLYLAGPEGLVEDSISTLQVFDLGDPTVPRRVGMYHHSGEFRALAVHGDYSLVVSRWSNPWTSSAQGGLQVIDVQTLSNVEFDGRVEMTPWQAHRTFAAGDYLYVSESWPQEPPAQPTNRLEIIDARDRLNPRSVGALSGGFQPVAISGSKLFMLSEFDLHIMDATHPENPRPLGMYTHSNIVQNIGVFGDYALLGAQDQLVVLDISDPTSPRRIGSYPITATGDRIEIEGTHAYVIGWLENGEGGLHVLDIGDPANPKRSGTFITSGVPSIVRVSGGRAFVGLFVWGEPSPLVVLDISNPAAPTELARYHGMQLFGVLGGLVYVSRLGGLEAYDASNPLDLKLINRVKLSDFVSNISVSEKGVYVADSRSGLQILRFPKLKAPAVARFTTTGDATDLAVGGSYLYLADGEAGLRVLNAFEQGQARQIGQWSSDSTVRQVQIDNSHAYLIEGRDAHGFPASQLSVLTITNPVAPHRVGTTTLSLPGKRMVVRNRLAYVTEGDGPFRLEIIDLADPNNPKPLGFCETIGTHSPVVSGRYLYLVAHAYFQVIDIGDATKPQPVALVPTGDTATGIGASGSFVYVTGASGFSVFDASAAPSFRLLTRNEVGASYPFPASVPIAGRYAYAGNVVFDVSDPARPSVAARLPSFVTPIAAAGSRIYTVSGPAGLRIFEANLANPQHLGSQIAETNQIVVAAAAFGNYALLAARREGLVVFDISNPNRPERVAHYDTEGWWVERVVVSGEYAWLSEQTNPHRLEVVRITNPYSPEGVGHFDFKGLVSPPAVVGTRAYVSESTVENSKLLVLDASNLASLKQIGSCDLSGDGTAVAALGQLACVVGPKLGLQVIDVSEPSYPRPIGRYTNSGDPTGVVMTRSHAFIADRELGLVIVDIHEPSNPAHIAIAKTSSRPERLTLDGNYVYLVGWGSSIDVVDVRMPGWSCPGVDTCGFSTGFVLRLLSWQQRHYLPMAFDCAWI